jgi:serine/threonine protein kinase
MVTSVRDRQRIFDAANLLYATWERAYYRRGPVFLKRSLRPQEFKRGERGLHVPRAHKEKLMNEAASLRFVKESTDIPVSAFYGEFEEDGAYCLMTEYVEGVKMKDLTVNQKRIVIEEVKHLIATLQGLKSSNIGGPSGLVMPPHRTTTQIDVDTWNLRPAATNEYVFCHNDLSQYNIIVDPVSLKIVAIIDWEFAGFYPAFFEMEFYLRMDGAPGSAAIRDEIDDTAQIFQFLETHKI